MTNELRQQISRLQHLNLAIRCNLERAEFYVPRANAVIEQLFAVGALEPTMHLGDIVFESRYPANGPEDSTVLVQAALAIGSGGFGGVFWDALDFVDFVKNRRPVGGVTLMNFTPFAMLPPTVKSLLLPQVEPLLAHACRLLRNK